ncbi:MAG: glycine oxidase ThiO [Defluviitaleaceae bacterium]|nr:glycine oxidase ThiO [Defluviitaleaceae bacterium]
MGKNWEVIVVGGGVMGNAIAYYVQQSGRNVLLLEKETIGNGASFAAAGMLGAGGEMHEVNDLFKLARLSRDMFVDLQADIQALSGIDIELINQGIIKLATDHATMDQLQAVSQRHQAVGEKTYWLDREAILAKEPALSGDFLGGILIENDGQVNAVQLTKGLHQSARALGAAIRTGVDVHDFVTENGKITGVTTNQGPFYGEKIVVASGAWSVDLLKKANLKLDTYPVKGEALSVITDKAFINSSIFSEQCYMVPKHGNRLIIGATMTPGTFSTQVNASAVAMLLQAAISLIPEIGQATFERAWAGIRPQTFDEFPFLSPHPTTENLFVCTGHYRNGILLAPISGKLIADMINGKPLPHFIDAFSLTRK